VDVGCDPKQILLANVEVRIPQLSLYRRGIYLTTTFNPIVTMSITTMMVRILSKRLKKAM
jgi:hypothetical protein